MRELVREDGRRGSEGDETEREREKDVIMLQVQLTQGPLERSPL